MFTERSVKQVRLEIVVLEGMLFIGYLYGIRSEIRLLKEIEGNVQIHLHTRMGRIYLPGA